MIDRIKNYLLWPLLAITLALSVYLVFVFLIYQILSNSDYQQEEKLWDFIANDMPYQQIDKKRQKEVQDIIDKLPRKFLPTQYSKINVVVLISDDVNAFAAPGGRIIITTGLLEQNLSQDALLFVIGHEMAHLSRKDHIYEFAKMIAAKSYGFLSGSEIVTELLLLADNSKLKETEFLADRFSAEILYSNSKNIDGAEEFFQYLISSNRYEQSSSHPSAEERLKRISSAVYY